MEWKIFDQNIEELLKRFLISNLKTGNFVSLIRVIILRYSELKNSVLTENNLFIWQVRLIVNVIFESIFLLQTYNALFIVRNVVKFMVERIKEEVMLPYARH